MTAILLKFILLLLWMTDSIASEQLHGLIVMLCSHCMLLYLLISLYHAAFYGLHQYTGCNKKQHGEKGNSKTSFQENVWLPPKLYFPY